MVELVALLILESLATLRARAFLLGSVIYPSVLYLVLRLTYMKGKDDAYLVAALASLALVGGCFSSGLEGSRPTSWGKLLNSLPLGKITIVTAERLVQYLLSDLSVLALFLVTDLYSDTTMSFEKFCFLDLGLLVASAPFFWFSTILRVKLSVGSFRLIGRILPLLLLTNLMFLVPGKANSIWTSLLRWSPFSSMLQFGWGIVGGFPPSSTAVFAWLGLWIVALVFMAEGALLKRYRY